MTALDQRVIREAPARPCTIRKHRPDSLHRVFFTGKGGVGKTALACATAIRLADAGKCILLVSTDTASNLDDMLGASLSNRPTPIPDVDGLFALNIDPRRPLTSIASV